MEPNKNPQQEVADKLMAIETFVIAGITEANDGIRKITEQLAQTQKQANELQRLAISLEAQKALLEKMKQKLLSPPLPQ